MGCHLWGHTESDTTERLTLSFTGIASLVAQMEKNLPAMRETWVQSLGQEDPLENRMTTPSSILAWRIPWTEETRGLQSDMIEQLTTQQHNEIDP